MSNFADYILMCLGFLTIAWVPLWIYQCFRQYQFKTLFLLAKKFWQLFLAMCVLVTTFQTFSWLKLRIQLEDRQLIDTRYVQFREALESHNHEKAYYFMAPNYREKTTTAEFKEEFAANYFPYLHADRLLKISSNRARFIPEYNVYEEFWQNSIDLQWIKIEDEWYLTGEIGWILD